MKNSKDLVKFVISDFEARKQARRGIEANWLLNINFLMGNQYAELTSGGEIIDSGKQFYWQQREVFNHIAPIIETRLAKFTRIKAGVSVRPTTGDLADVNTAKFATKLINSVKEDNNLAELTRMANYWSEVTGTSFYKVVWNPEKGNIVAENENKPLYEGDVEITAIPPYEIYPDSLCCQTVEECNSIIHAKAYPVKVIEDTFNVKLKGRDISVINLDSAASGVSQSNMKAFQSTVKNHEVVIERYQRPDKEFPNGRLTIVAGNELLFDGELPYENGINGTRCFPFVRQVALSQPASFFGASIIDRIIPVQRAYNAVKNRKHEYMNRLALGVMTIEEGSVDMDNLEEEGLAPGKVLIYRQGSTPPRMMSPGNVPAEFRDEEDRLLEEFISISGVSDFLSTSYLSRDNMSGVALSLLVDQDDTRLSVTSEEIRNALRCVGQQVLRLYRQFAMTKRLRRISGDNGEMEMVAFTGSEITNDDLVFDTENELSDTPASRKSTALEILKMGLLTDENGKLSESAKCKMLELMGFGNWESARSIDDLHIKQANKENFKVAEGEEIEVKDVDKHSLHINEHTAFLISDEASISDEAVKKLDEHIREHRRYNRLQKEADALNTTTRQ